MSKQIANGHPGINMIEAEKHQLFVIHHVAALPAVNMRRTYLGRQLSGNGKLKFALVNDRQPRASGLEIPQQSFLYTALYVGLHFKAIIKVQGLGPLREKRRLIRPRNPAQPSSANPRLLDVSSVKGSVLDLLILLTCQKSDD